MMLAIALLACTGGPSEEATANARAELAGATSATVPADADGLGWVSRVAYDPAAFAALTASSKEGWIALHGNDPAGAVEKFADDRIGRARAELVLVVLYDDLSRVAGLAADRLFTQWASKGTLPKGNDAPMVAALAAACSGGESAGTWASKVEGGPDAPIAQAMMQGRSPTDIEAPGPYGQRMAMHRRARASGDPTALLAAAEAPIVSAEERATPAGASRPSSTAFERRYWDPCVYQTLSRLWLDRAARDLGGNGWRSVGALAEPSVGLAGTFLAPWATASDLEAELTAAEPGAKQAWLGLLGAHSPTVRQLGVGTSVAPSDDAEAARTEVALLDAGLDAWSMKLLDQAPADGQGIVADLDLIPRFRQEWIAARARLALTRGHARMALSYAELARDHATPGIGPANGASLYVIAAEAQLLLGHTREALDLLHVVSEALPEARGIEETAGDLAVLQGIDRHGDSKEDP